MQRKKVLVIRLSSLGDITHASAVIAPLRAANCEIHFATKASFVSLLSSHPDIKSVYAFDKKKGGEKAARQDFFAWAEKQKFDFVLDLHDSLRTKVWRWQLKKMSRVYVAKKERLREWGIFLFRLRKTLGFGRGGRAKKMQHLALFALEKEGFSVEVKNLPLTDLRFAPEALLKMKSKVPATPFAVFLPGSAWPTKEWKYFPALAEKFFLPVVALGSGKDAACAEIVARAQTKHPESVSLHGQTSIEESMAVLSLATMVVGNDTGMLHVAEALGKNVVVIEGPTHESLGFSPYREGSTLVGLDLLCRPCSKTGRFCWRFGTHACLQDLSPDTVLAAISEGPR